MGRRKGRREEGEGKGGGGGRDRDGREYFTIDFIGVETGSVTIDFLTLNMCTSQWTMHYIVNMACFNIFIQV